ncbi:unnamed protein product [Urochloa decumbens]|uniref:Uncharacterized protein n=1 Tax=Urochloa decumbens TaxID=240449 RepID=A0ABC9D2I4_9POAL
MDFLALPRRDLQALCKRNGVRANMTNAAMAEALAALPMVDGIEEYVKQPVAVPAPAAKAAVAVPEEEEPRLQKQGSPLPRGRRVTAKAKEPSKAEDAKQANATREQNTEDAPAPRRGASRRARGAPVVPKATGKASVEEEKQGSSPLVEDGEAEEELKREANKEDAPAPVVARQGASRRARPAPAAEPAGTGVGEEQREKEGSQVPRGRRGAVKPSEPDDREETTEKGDLKRKASTDDASSHGVGRRGPSRLARPAPALEQQTAPIPRGRNLKAKSTKPIMLNDGEEDEKEGGKPEEADVPALVVGRRGASRRARGAPAVAGPAGNAAAEEEPTAPIQGSRGVSVKSPEVIRLDVSEEDEKEDTKLEEKVEDLPANGMGRRGTRRRAPAPAEASATRRKAATSKHEVGDVAVEAMAIRSTRQRKPTMKAVAAAEEKVPRRAPRRGVVRKTVMQQEEQEEPLGVVSDAEAVPAPVPDQEQEEPLEVVPAPVPDQEQEEPLEAVPAPVPDQGCDGPGDLEVCSDPHQYEEENQVVDAPKQEDEDVVIIEDEVLMEQTLKEQQVDDQKSPARMENQEDSPILGLVSMAAEVDKVANFQDAKYSNEEPLLEAIHDAGEEVEMVSSIQTLEDLVTLTDGESTKEVVTGDANRESEMGGSNEILHSKEEISAVDTEDDDASQEKENMDIDELQAELVSGAVLFDCSGTVSMVDEEKANEVNTEDSLGCKKKGDVAVDTVLPDREEISEVDTEDDDASQEKENTDIDELQAELVNDAVLFDCSGNISMVDKEKANEVNTEDSLGCQKKGDVAVDTVLPDRQEISKVDTEDDFVSLKKENKDIDELQTELAVETILFDCSGNISLVYAEKTNEVNTEGGAGCQQKRDVAVDTALPYMAVALEIGDAVEENSAAITRDMPHSSAVVDEHDEETEIHPDERQQTMATEDEAIGDDDIDTDFDNGDKQMELVADDNLPEQAGTYHKLTAQEMAALCTEEMPQSTTTMDEDIEEDQFQAVSADQAVLIGSKKVKRTDDEIVEEDKAVVITEDVPQSTGTMDEYVEEDQVKIEVARADDNVVEMSQTEDDIVQKESPFTVDLAGDSSDHTTSALLENVTESLSKSIITLKPTESVFEGISVCNNSSEKNTAEPPVALQEEEGVKVVKKSVDLNKLSIRQLRTKIKEKLNAKKNKEAKRVALARVDENVCQSQPKGPQQNLNLQQH